MIIKQLALSCSSLSKEAGERRREMKLSRSSYITFMVCEDANKVAGVVHHLVSELLVRSKKSLQLLQRTLVPVIPGTRGHLCL